MLSSSIDYFSISIESLNDTEIEFWIYKSLSIYKNSKIKNVQQMNKIWEGASYILKEKKLNNQLEGILLSLEDNLRYDLKITILKENII